MLNYIRAEFYKVLHRKYVWITLTVALALEAGLVAAWALIGDDGSKLTFSFGVTNLTFLLGLGFYAALLTGDMVFAGQHKYGTLKNEVSFGLNRARIYFGKLIAQTILSILFCVVILVFYLALCAATQSHDPQTDVRAFRLLGRCLAAVFPLWAGVQAMVCAMMFLIPSELGSAFTAAGILAVLPYIVYFTALILSGVNGSPVGSALMAAYEHMPTVMANRADAMAGDLAWCGRAWIVGAAWFAAFTAIGLCGFRKKEIK